MSSDRLPAWLDPADPRPEVAAALRAWLDLQQGLALRPQDAVAALAQVPEPREALRRCGRPPAPPARLEATVDVLRRVGALALPWLSPAYPERARHLADAAPLLLVRGDPRVLSRPCVAVVGARAATAYGRAQAERFAGALAQAGVVVVSGLAAGIDAAAHRAALDVGGATLAVQACGPDRVYPARHRELAERIVASGAVLSEFPPGMRPRPGFFPLRNRLISALSSAVLVIEARERSGSLVTAGHAANQGVEVWAVPGPLSSPASAGTNRLLAEGASVALAPERLLEWLHGSGLLHGSGVLPRTRPRAAPAAAAPPLAPSARAIVEALLERPCTRDELARRLERSPAELALDLLDLELGGALAEDRDGRLRVVAPEKVGL
ncbi:MAG: DNA-processing protein DprA [Myxococcota bacterium]|nr:DNA-processing protein DprA [Myxococcota bacterium]